MFEKRLREVEITAKAFRVPGIPPPAFWAVDRRRFVGRINRNDRSFAEVAISSINASFVAKNKTSNLAASRAECRRRHFDFSKKSLVRVRDGESIPAFCAFICNFGHASNKRFPNNISHKKLSPFVLAKNCQEFSFCISNILAQKVHADFGVCFFFYACIRDKNAEEEFFAIYKNSIPV